TTTSGSTPAAQISAPNASTPTRLHMPMWQLLLLTVPVLGLVLALSWHHLRPHSDDDHGAIMAPTTTSSAAPAAANDVPNDDKTPAGAPAKQPDKTMSSASPAQPKLKSTSAHAANDVAKSPDKGAAAATAATFAGSPANDGATLPASKPAA